MNGPGITQSLTAANASPTQFSQGVASLAGSYHPAKVTLKPNRFETMTDYRYPYELWTGSDFDITRGPIYPTTFDINLGSNEFHFEVWRNIPSEGGNSKTHGFISTLPDVSGRLAFVCKEDADRFDVWLRRYKTFYTCDLTVDLPGLPDRSRIALTTILRDAPKSRENLIQEWAWIIENCAGNAFFSDNRFIFTDDASAVAYRIRWMGA